jgi:alpha/beta hydrolase fold
MSLKQSVVCSSTCAFLALVCSGCMHDPQYYHLQTQQLAEHKHWQESYLSTESFSLSLFKSENYCHDCEKVTIFIEGDGFAWINKYTPSDNPTPKNPVALKVALALENNASAYLGRPCQNVFDENWNQCESRYWTIDRFSPKIIYSMNEAVSKIKQIFNAKKLIFVGYSGGGVIALLLASQRNDVEKVITLASNIDTEEWVKYHNISSLNGENPALLSSKLASVKQVHYVGADDTIVPESIGQSFSRYYPENHKPEIRIVEGFNHNCCWEEVEKYWK